MKTQFERNTERTGLTLRTDIKAAMEELRVKQCRLEGGYVSLGRMFSLAALLFLEREGIILEPEPLATLPVGKPVKSLVRRKRPAMAVRA